MFVSRLLRRRVLELEQREDWNALHTLMRTWPWSENERHIDPRAAFEDVTRRIREHDLRA